MKKILLWIILISALGIAQQLVVKTNEGMSTYPALSTAISASFINNTVSTAASSEETIRLIVELKSPSRIEQKMSRRSFSKSSSIQAKQEILTVVNVSAIEKEFENVFSGFVMTTKRENLEKIASLPGVKNVYPDVIVHSTPISLNSAIRFVPQSTTSVASGKGIRIGVIDTGIDYNHEAFGGGFGNNFVITGGYDFVNNDPDPMDDNGHGTHVAGIISGQSSTINGLANNAKIFAYKALDKNGSGSASSLIAAIERAIDDSVQILNLSLGSPGGNSGDPLTQAVNRAVQSGIVVVAAGNTGGFGTINSPGAAKYALTVGATEINSIASFSAKGPVTEGYQIKPDVVAPGVGVLSAKNGGGYVQMSGTSMATPFVTSIAAGLKELHPDWSAFQIKDAIISNAIDLHSSVFSQGHGKIDEQILRSDIFVSPAQVSFGFNPPAQSTWSQKETVRVYNKTGLKKKYQLISASTNPAVQFRFAPQSIEIGPMQDSEIEIELVTNNVLLTNNNEFENGYTGKILAVGESDTLVIPYAFFKGTVMQIRFNEIPWQIMVHDQKNFSKMISPKTNQLSLIMNEGTYDVAALFFGSRYVIKENVAVSGHSDIPISSGDASLPVSFQPINELGENLNLSTLNGTYSNLEVLVHRTTGFAIISMGGGKTKTYVNRNKYFSTLSDKYSYGFSLNIQPSNLSSYTYDFSVDSGINSSRSIIYTREELKHLEVQFRLDTVSQRIFPITWTSYMGKTNTVSVTFYDGTAQPLTYPFIQKAFYTQRPSAFPIFHQREAFRY